MYSKTNGFVTQSASPNINRSRLAYLEAPKRLLSDWIWNSDPSKSSGKRLVLRWRLDRGANDRALDDLRRMSDHELSDIGLSRSDLTLEGLAIAGAKRAQRQDTISMEIAELAREQKAHGHGD